jgi:hypothetical protein
MASCNLHCYGLRYLNCELWDFKLELIKASAEDKMTENFHRFIPSFMERLGRKFESFLRN